MNKNNSIHYLDNGKWKCKNVVEKQDDGSAKYANALSALYKELRKVLITHEDCFLPENGLGKQMAIMNVMSRINYYRLSRGWSTVTLNDLKGRAI